METTWEPQPIEQKKEYAGFWIRFAAYLLDGIIVGILVTMIYFIVLLLAFGSSLGLEELMDKTNVNQEITDQEVITFLIFYLLSILVVFVLTSIYYAGMHSSRWQATVGKKLLGLIITDMKGDRISFWRGLGRYFAMAFLSGIFMIGYIMAAFTEKKQSLHDLIAGTVVLKN